MSTTMSVLRGVTYVFVGVSVIVFLWYIAPRLSPDTIKPKEVTILYVAPLSLSSTDVSLNSVKLALHERNYRAGSVKVTLQVVDDGDATGAWDEYKERKAARAAAENESVVAYLGPLSSGAAKISMPILNEAGIVQISPSNTWPGLTKAGFLPGEPSVFYPSGIPHYVRVAPTDDLQGPAGARWAGDLGFRHVYVVNDSDPYGIGIADLFTQEAEKIGLIVDGTAAITLATTSYSVVGDAIITSSTTDLIYYGGSTTNGGPELLRYLRSRGSTVAFMGPDGIFEQEFITRAGTSSEGAYVTAIGTPPPEARGANAEHYLRLFRDTYKTEPDVFGALAYDATVALIGVIERAGTDRARILREMKQLKNQPGVFGVWSFNQAGDTTLELLSGSQVVDGAFEFKGTLSENL
jgi:branched-chain amino acid transport system substrate-binding protein